MISRNQLKYLHSLRIKKFRDLNQAFVVEGVKMVDELLASNFTTVQVYGTAGWLDSRKALLDSLGIYYMEISESELERASNLSAPNEVIAIVSFPEGQKSEEELGNIVLLLDKLQDPGNLGTIIRTADWFGIRHIYCSKDSVDVFNPKVIQSTMGSVFRVNVHYRDLTEIIDGPLSEYNVYAANAGCESIYDIPVTFPAAVVIGNESQGISEELLRMTTIKIGIPSVSGSAESLNASVAAGILCSEFTRKLKAKTDHS